MADSAQDIRDRAFAFACAVAKLALQIEPRPGLRCIVDQLLSAATSVGANLEEAKAGSSRREFIRYVEIALREVREATYWLRICVVLDLGSRDDLNRLVGEAGQIGRILGAIVVNAQCRTRTVATVLAVFAFCILNFALLFS
jgi:four helix bundle protein